MNFIYFTDKTFPLCPMVMTAIKAEGCIIHVNCLEKQDIFCYTGRKGKLQDKIFPCLVVSYSQCPEIKKRQKEKNKEKHANENPGPSLNRSIH